MSTTAPTTADRDNLAALIKATVFSPHPATITTLQAIADAVIAAGWVRKT